MKTEEKEKEGRWEIKEENDGNNRDNKGGDIRIDVEDEGREGRRK